jgi:hypothetical protein
MYFYMVVPTGVEPVTSSMSTKRSTTELRNYVWCLWQESNLHTQAYLACALTRYKLASLPLSYRGI